mgnify:CR=1 FL=1
MPVKVAISSADGKTVHQHFGRTTQFIICEIDQGQGRFVEVRSNQPACGGGEEDGHDEDRIGRSVELVADCRAVLCAQIGGGAVARLAERGIQAFVIPDFIESALERLIASNVLDQPVRPSKRWLESSPAA